MTTTNTINDLARKIAVLMQALMRPARLSIPPIHMQYEPSSKCNLNCVHCDRLRLQKYPKNASLDDFIEIFNAFNPLYLTMNGYGEPLMCPDTAKMIHYATSKGCKVNLTTNGIFLGKYTDELLSSGLDLVNISLDAASAETYAKIRQADMFSKIVKNTLRFSNKNLKSPNNLKLRLSMVVQEANINELAGFVSLAKDIDAEIALFQIVETSFFAQRDEQAVGKLTQDMLKSSLAEAARTAEEIGMRSNASLLHENMDKQWLHHIERKSNSGNCWKPWMSVYVTADSQLRPCCNFVDEKLNFGKYQAGKPTTAVNTKRFKRFRKQLAQHKRPCKPCQSCIPETLSEILFREKF